MAGGILRCHVLVPALAHSAMASVMEPERERPFERDLVNEAPEDFAIVGVGWCRPPECIEPHVCSERVHGYNIDDVAFAACAKACADLRECVGFAHQQKSRTCFVHGPETMSKPRSAWLEPSPLLKKSGLLFERIRSASGEGGRACYARVTSLYRATMHGWTCDDELRIDQVNNLTTAYQCYHFCTESHECSYFTFFDATAKYCRRFSGCPVEGRFQTSIQPSATYELVDQQGPAEQADGDGVRNRPSADAPAQEKTSCEDKHRRLRIAELLALTRARGVRCEGCVEKASFLEALCAAERAADGWPFSAMGYGTLACALLTGTAVCVPLALYLTATKPSAGAAGPHERLHAAGLSPDAPEEPARLTCPITNMMYRDPVFTSSGQTYDRDTLVQFWEMTSGAPRDPLSNTRCKQRVTTNWSKRSEVDEFLETHPTYTPQGWPDRTMVVPQDLPDDLAVGMSVVSLIDFQASNGSVAKGDVGQVVGQSSVEPDKRVRVDFPNIKSLQVQFTEVSRRDLPGGFAVGMAVVSLIDFQAANGSVAKGDVGEVIGQSSSDADNRVECGFPNIKRLQVHLAEITRRDLPGGFTVGMTVVSLIDFQNASGSVAKGDVGQVVGQSDSEPDKRVRCDFPNSKNLGVLLSEISRRDLPGGFAVGMAVVSLIDFQNASGSVAKGDVGQVIGQSNSEPDKRVRCDFPNLKNLGVLLSEISRRDLPGGFAVGMAVVSLIDFQNASGSVAKGDVGQVVGQSNSEPEKRVRCDFPSIKDLQVLLTDISSEEVAV